MRSTNQSPAATASASVGHRPITSLRKEYLSDARWTSMRSAGLGGAGSEVVASVDSSAYRTARDVEDVIAEVGQLIFAEGLLQPIRFLLTLARRKGHEHIKRRPQLLLRWWIAINPVPDPGGALL